MKRLICLFLTVTLCLTFGGCSLISSYGDGVPDVLGTQLVTIHDDSMEPTFHAGETIICREVKDPALLEIGDIIAFWTVINGQREISVHRIYEIYDGGGYLLFQTKGDNAVAVDQLTVHENDIIGEYIL